MITKDEIRLALRGEAFDIAAMSRDYIESGLGWSWTPRRVLDEIRSPKSNVIVTAHRDAVIGFAVMVYREEEARLNLFGVHPQHRRKGVGTRMVRWLEETALVNGSGILYLETRSSNHTARDFYRCLGFREIQRIPGFYARKESAVRMGKDLWLEVAAREG